MLFNELDDELKDKFTKAIKLLEKHKHNWYNDVSVHRLDMSNEHNCILGQLFGYYNKNEVYVKAQAMDCYWDVFSCYVNKDLWIEIINHYKSGKTLEKVETLFTLEYNDETSLVDEQDMEVFKKIAQELKIDVKVTSPAISILEM